MKRYSAEVGDEIQPHLLPSHAAVAHACPADLWQLHKRLTRNQRSQSLTEQAEQVIGWFAQKGDLSSEQKISAVWMPQAPSPTPSL